MYYEVGSNHPSTDIPIRKFESFLKDSGNADDGYIRKIIVYEAKKAVVDTTKYHKGKKKKAKKVITVQAPEN